MSVATYTMPAHAGTVTAGILVDLRERLVTTSRSTHVEIVGPELSLEEELNLWRMNAAHAFLDFEATLPEED